MTARSGTITAYRLTPRLILRQMIHRVQEFMFKSDVDSCEVLSAGANLWCALVLWLSPDYVVENARLARLVAYLPTGSWAILFATVGAFQSAMFLLGGPPHLLSPTQSHQLQWLRGRRDGHLMALFLLGVTALLMNSQGITFIAGLLALFAGANIWGAWRTSTLIGAEHEKLRMEVITKMVERGYPEDAIARVLESA